MEENKKENGKLMIVLGYIFAVVVSPILFFIGLAKIIREKESIKEVKKAVFILLISILLMAAEAIGAYIIINGNPFAKGDFSNYKKSEKNKTTTVEAKKDVNLSNTSISFFRSSDGSYTAEVNSERTGAVSKYQCEEDDCAFFYSDVNTDYVLLTDPRFVIYNVKNGKSYKADTLEFAVDLEGYKPYETNGELVGLAYTTTIGDSYYDLRNDKVVYSTEKTGEEILKCIPEIKKRHLVVLEMNKNNDLSVVVRDIDNNNKELFRVNGANQIITNDVVVYFFKGFATSYVNMEELYDGNYKKIAEGTKKSFDFYLDDDGTFIFSDQENVVVYDSSYKVVSKTKIEGLDMVLDKETSVAYRNNKAYVVSNKNGSVIKEYTAKGNEVA